MPRARIRVSQPLMNRTVAALSLLLAVLSGCTRSAPATVAATVNGRAITYPELDKQFQSQFGGQGEASSGDQAMIQKLEVLRTLVDNEIMLQRAEKLGLMAADADVEKLVREQLRTGFAPAIPINTVELRLVYDSDLQRLDYRPRKLNVRTAVTAPPPGWARCTPRERPPQLTSKPPATAPKATEKKDAGKKTAATGEKKKRTKARKETYSSYIYKVLKQVHPDTGISNRAMSILNSFVNGKLHSP